MFVCLCKNVSDRQLKQAVEDGADSWRAVRLKTECATQCGKCACTAKGIVDDALARKYADLGLGYAV